MKKTLTLIIVFCVFAVGLPISASAAREPVIVAFGDSITAADKWQKVLEQKLGFDIINKGFGGDSSRTAKSRFKRDVLDLKPDIVIISFGTNDAAIDMEKYTPLEDYKANMAYFIDSCLETGARVLVNIPLPIDDAPYLTRHDPKPFEPYGGPNGLLSLYAQAAREVALEKGVLYADVNQAFLDTGKYAKYISDGIHPNDSGYKLYGESVLPIYLKLWLGDVNGDCRISSADYAMVKRQYLGSLELTEQQLLRADMNGDGYIRPSDFAMLKRMYLGTYKP